MITRLRLSNFRRHAETDLIFDPTEQTVVISGANGSGKSTILESILFGLYGEGRHGPRRLDDLVRRGAELEGMEVEVGFTMGVDTYRVVRRREGRTASAVLFANDNQIVEGVRPVTAAVAAILGMDAAGFRLAVVAQQKELDGLARLGGTQRAKQLARLLRLDAITRARDDARGRHRIAEKVLASLPAGDDLSQLATEVARAEAAAASSASATADARAAVAEIEAELAATTNVDETYHHAKAALAGATATLAAVRAEADRLSAERDTVVVPDAPSASDDVEELERRASEVERAIAQGEASARVASQRTMLEAELARVEARLVEIAEIVEAHGDARSAMGRADVAAEDERAARDAVVAAAGRRDTLREEFSAKRAEAKMLGERLDAIRSLGAECDACGQDIAEEHRHTQEEAAAAKLAVAEAEAAALLDEGRAEASALAAAEAKLVEAETAKAAAEVAMREVASLEGESTELNRRRDTYAAQLDRLVADAVDVEGLYAQKGAIALAVMEAREVEEARRRREAALERVATLELALAASAVRVSDAEAAVEAARLDTDLEEAYQQRAVMVERHREELELASALAAEAAAAKEKVSSAKAALVRGNELAASRRTHQQSGVVAANAAKLLSDVETRLTTQIRPALEGAVSDLLTKLSEGRFTTVRIGLDYTVRVLDDGKYRTLGEFSGGEIDLIALAVRLGLGEVVADRHGSGGAGFLILDEVFGSQDEGRRTSIMAALRGLRSTYGQVLCISHVGGLEDAADRVIEVELDNATGTALVT